MEAQDNVIRVSYDPPVEPAGFNLICVLFNGVNVANTPFLVHNLPASHPTSPAVRLEIHKIGVFSTVIATTVDGDGHRRLVGGVNIMVQSTDPVLGILGRGVALMRCNISRHPPSAL